MGLIDQWASQSKGGQRVLQWVNLRSEEAERTFLMFAFYAATSIGLVWLEAITTDLFLTRFTAEGLPWIYIASAGIGSGLSFAYSQLQRFLPLRRVIVITAFLMVAPLGLFWLGLAGGDVDPLIWNVTVVGVTVFLMRLWIEAVNVLNDLNTSITANQLFNIREIKRTYPLISSGILVADVISGFSLGFLIRSVGLNNVVLLAAVIMAIGAGILLYLSQAYQQAFPDFYRRRADAEERLADFSTNRPLQGPTRRYVILLFMFFILAQVLLLLVDFLFQDALQQRYASSEGQIAAFLGVFNGTLGIFEVATQWLASSRLIERVGVFATSVLLPGGIAILSALAFSSLAWRTPWMVGELLIQPAFVVLVLLKFYDELLHYTLFASVSPVLFQPIPDSFRSHMQAVVRGIAEPISTGITGLALVTLSWVLGAGSLDWLFPAILILALVWVLVILLLRAKYVNLLVMSAERGQLSRDVDELELRRWVVETLEKPGPEARKQSCIDLLSKVDPKSASEVLATHLMGFSPQLQQKSLEAMLLFPNSHYLQDVKAVIEQSPPPKVLALALRFVWLTEEEPDIRQLRPYLRDEVDPVVRGTAASLMMRRGSPKQKAEATQTLRRMLTSKSEKERMVGCQALGDTAYLQALRIHIPALLQDESLRVRRAILEAIAATHFEEYYPSLLLGLQYKSTREAAMTALVRLDNEAIPMLVELAEDVQKPDAVRLYAWQTIGQIGSVEALDALISNLKIAWGVDRRNILRILLELPNEVGSQSVFKELGRRGIEQLIDQELMFIGRVFAGLLDISPEQVQFQEVELLRRSLQGLQIDAQERIFMLMQFMYPVGAIKAAAFNLQSNSRSSKARGLEILDNTLDIPSKRALLILLDRNSDQEKMKGLSELVRYEPLPPSERLRELLNLRHVLSDWSIACCFHLARQAQWRLTPEQALACLRHAKGFVREAVLAYLWMASPRALEKLLPLLQTDPDRLVLAQVEKMIKEFEQKSPRQEETLPPPLEPLNSANRPELGTI
ncbi:MAG: Npt1/Npt2 family nucleotide transporter [Leptolyngbyaceae cyanobacterium bins.349]|nr:Npt1/Npt2 family nucleotide transporter [Leptolyngbyaceae cyanobacterium bins.349]